MLWQAYACGCDLSRKEASIWLSSPVKYALEKQNTKKVSQGKLSCYRSKFHPGRTPRGYPVQRGERGKGSPLKVQGLPAVFLAGF